MKRIVAVAAAFVIAVAAVAFAGQEAAKGTKVAAADPHAGHAQATPAKSQAAPAAKSSTWTGEILDSGCYLGKGAMGAGHAECALKCASQGMPMLLLTKDGKAMLLTPNHDNPDAYEALKGMAGSVATVTGTFSERGGIKGIDVTAAKVATK